MTTRELTVFHLARHCAFTPHEITSLMRLAATHQRLSVMRCNGDGSGSWDGYHHPWCDADDAKLERVRGRIKEICETLNARTTFTKKTERRYPFFIGAVLGGDPRGATVKITTPDGFSDDWGRTGICL